MLNSSSEYTKKVCPISKKIAYHIIQILRGPTKKKKNRN